MKCKMLTVSLTLTACLLTGCSAFQRADGSPDPEKIEHTTQAAATTLSYFGPAGQIAALVVGAIGTGFAAHYRGKESGWNEAVGTPPTPGKPAQAKVPPTT